MICKEQTIAGLFLIESESQSDDRGVFTRTFCRQELQNFGVAFSISQCNSSYTADLGTIRGIHYQKPPAAEGKLIRCTQGRIFDVVVDLRPESRTFLQTFTIQLDSAERVSLLIPERCGHALQTLRDHTVIEYCSSESHNPAQEGGLRWNDPDLDINWPVPLTKISEKDRKQPLLKTQLTELHEVMTI